MTKLCELFNEIESEKTLNIELLEIIHRIFKFLSNFFYPHLAPYKRHFRAGFHIYYFFLLFTIY